jgi:hypothetical protein
MSPEPSAPILKFVASRAVAISGYCRRLVDGVIEPQRRRGAEKSE